MYIHACSHLGSCMWCCTCLVAVSMWLKVVSTCLKTAANTCIVYTFCFFLAVLDGLLSGMALIVELF